MVDKESLGIRHPRYLRYRTACFRACLPDTARRIKPEVFTKNGIDRLGFSLEPLLQQSNHLYDIFGGLDLFGFITATPPDLAEIRALYKKYPSRAPALLFFAFDLASQEECIMSSALMNEMKALIDFSPRSDRSGLHR